MKTLTAPTPNAPLAYATLDYLHAHPGSLNMKDYRRVTGGVTFACFGGRTLMLSGIEITKDQLVRMDEVSPELADAVLEVMEAQYHSVPDAYPVVCIDAGDVAQTLLGLSFDQTCDLFCPNNDLTELRRLIAEIFGPRPLTDDGALTMTDAEITAELSIDRLALPQPSFAEELVALEINNATRGNR